MEIKRQQKNDGVSNINCYLIMLKDDWFWKKRASLEFRKGNLAKAHFFVAKGFLAIGNEIGAIEQLTLARSVESKQQKILKLKIEAELDRLRRIMSSYRLPLG